MTLSLPGDCVAGSTKVEVYGYDFEDGAQGWTHTSLQGSDTWALSGANPNSGVQHWHVNDVSSISDQVLVSPSLSIPADLSGLTFQFFNYQELEDGGAGCYDGGVLEVSIGGGSFGQVPDNDLLTDPYDGTIDAGFANPLAGRNAWCGDPQPYLNSVVDISNLAGENNVVFRFRLAFL